MGSSSRLCLDEQTETSKHETEKTRGLGASSSAASSPRPRFDTIYLIDAFQVNQEMNRERDKILKQEECETRR